MSYTVKEIFFTLQGEGANTGRPAVFCRFAGCNLWTGREEDRDTAVCQFCDTDFVGVGPDGGKFDTPESLVAAVVARWPADLAQSHVAQSHVAQSHVAQSHVAQSHVAQSRVAQSRVAQSRVAQSRVARSPDAKPFVVCTGGEPLLQLDAPLLDAFHRAGCTVAVETNGTQVAPAGIDWICVSPKANAEMVLRHGNELKLVYPQKGADPERYAALPFDYFFLQPMDGPEREANTQQAIAYCLRHPRWRLSVQTHKVLGLR